MCVTAATPNMPYLFDFDCVHWLWPFQMSVRSSEVFELSPNRMSIPSHSHAFATINFTPQNMQTYHGVVEVSLEGAPG